MKNWEYMNLKKCDWRKTKRERQRREGGEREEKIRRRKRETGETEGGGREVEERERFLSRLLLCLSFSFHVESCILSLQVKYTRGFNYRLTVQSFRPLMREGKKMWEVSSSTSRTCGTCKICMKNMLSNRVNYRCNRFFPIGFSIVQYWVKTTYIFLLYNNPVSQFTINKK